jgi:hypothetical protein
LQSLFASNVGYTGPDVWRWGGIQNNGFDRSDPRFEEFAMIGADGLTHDRQGRLILATFAGRSLMRIEKDGTRTVLVDRYDGKRFVCATGTRARSSTSTACTCGRTASCVLVLIGFIVYADQDVFDGLRHGTKRVLLVVKITRQQNARRNQCDCDDERQPINNHSLLVIVLVGILVFCEAQQRSDICPTFLGEPAQSHGIVFGVRHHWLRLPQVFEVAG